MTWLCEECEAEWQCEGRPPAGEACFWCRGLIVCERCIEPPTLCGCELVPA